MTSALMCAAKPNFLAPVTALTHCPGCLLCAPACFHLCNALTHIQDLENAPNRTEPWDGVRNGQARKVLRSMRTGDLSFFYASNCKEVRQWGMHGLGASLHALLRAFHHVHGIDCWGRHVCLLMPDIQHSMRVACSRASWALQRWSGRRTQILPSSTLRAPSMTPRARARTPSGTSST